MVELIVYKKSEKKEGINNSPFCSKSEIYLKLNKVDHKVTVFEGNPSKFPKAKLPVIKHNGKLIEDSYYIEKYLNKEFNIDMDAHLSASEKAQGLAFTKLAENFFYWSVLHERWFIDSNWGGVKDFYFSSIPGLLRGFITKMIRKDARKASRGHGMGRHTDNEVNELGIECVHAFSNFLQDKPYLFGDKISSFDITIYAFVSSVLHSPFNPKLLAELSKHKNLVDYDKRMFKFFDK